MKAPKRVLPQKTEPVLKKKKLPFWNRQTMTDRDSHEFTSLSPKAQRYHKLPPKMVVPRSCEIVHSRDLCRFYLRLKKREVENPGEKGTGPPRRSPEGKGPAKGKGSLPHRMDVIPMVGFGLWTVSLEDGLSLRWTEIFFLRQEVELRINGFYCRCFFSGFF